MEFIFDELKQFVIKKVENFEDLDNNYLLVFYSNDTIDDKNIEAIILITKPSQNEYTRINCNVYYEKNGIKIMLYSPKKNQLFQIDKLIEFKKFLEIKNIIVNNMVLNNISLIKKINTNYHSSTNSYMIINY